MGVTFESATLVIAHSARLADLDALPTRRGRATANGAADVESESTDALESVYILFSGVEGDEESEEEPRFLISSEEASIVEKR